MAEIFSELALDISRSAANYFVEGWKQKVLIIPGSELDPITNITVSDETVITDIVPDAAAHLLEGINDLKILSGGFDYGKPADGRPTYIHKITGITLQDPDATVQEAYKDWAVGGGHVFGILERKWGGTDRDDAFHFFGFDHGLVMVPHSVDYQSGPITFDLQTPDGFTESLPPRIYLNTDYATTKADVWTSKLA